MPGKNTFTQEQRDLLKKINDDPNYTEPVDDQDKAKYKTGFERLINRALSDQCTAQDILNLGVVAANIKKYHSQKQRIVSELGVDFYDSICKFCNELTGLEKDHTNFQYFEKAGFFDEEPGYKTKSKMGLSPLGYVLLTDEQKLKLLGFREKIVNSTHYNELYGDAAFMKDAYDKLKSGAGNTAKTSIHTAATERDLVDRKDIASANGSIYAMKHTTVSNVVKIQAQKRPEAKKNIYDTFMEGRDRILELKEAWNSMEDHTKISFFNSKEFKTMERSYKAYIEAYENLASGRNIDGSPKKEGSKTPTQEDYVRLNQLQENMQDAAKAYTAAKREQKGGGIDRHSTKQGKDRLAMADALAEFNIFKAPYKDEYSPKITTTDELKANKDNAKVKTVTLEEIDNTANRGRTKLNKHIHKLEKNEELKNQPKANDHLKK